MPGPGHHNGKMERPKNVRKTFGRILAYLSEYRIQLALVVLLIVVSSGASVAGTAFLQQIVDKCLEPLAEQGLVPALVRQLAKAVALMLGIYVAGAMASWVYNRIMLNVTTGTLFQLRVDMYNKMETLPIRYFDSRTHGEIMSHYTNDADAVREMLSNSVTSVISSGITVVSTFIMMLVYSWQLTIVVILMMFVMIKVVGVVSGKSGAYFVKRQRCLGQLNGYIEEMIEGQRVVKVFCHEEAAKQGFEALNDEFSEAATKANIFANILGPLMNNLSHTLYAITAICGGVLAINGVLSLGVVIAFLQYTRSFSNPISQLSQQLNSVLTALAGAERIFGLIDQTCEEDAGTVTLVNATEDAQGRLLEADRHTGEWAWKQVEDGKTTLRKVEGNVVFRDVSFGYVPEKTVLHDVSLYARPGQKIAFVGSTGAGKTTITNLINRFYDIQSGSITYDGIDIQQIRKSDLRRSLSMVLQDTHLFTGTVRENIRYGNLNATDEEVENAAKLANADGFIRRLPRGYDTMVTADGANLSQGQRQLLAIARAAVADPPVLILDEATSSIDTRTEALVEKGMDRLMEGRTVFVIAHRLSTVRNSDAIMVLENGEIIERGNHDDLIAQHGRYYQLYTGMFELS